MPVLAGIGGSAWVGLSIHRQRATTREIERLGGHCDLNPTGPDLFDSFIGHHFYEVSAIRVCGLDNLQEIGSCFQRLHPRPRLYVDGTHIHELVENEESSKVEELLNKYPALIHACDSLDQTPLHVAAHAGKLSIVELLLKRGAPPDDQAYNAFTPLHLADDERVINLILDMHPDLPARWDHREETPLQQAIVRSVDAADADDREKWRRIANLFLGRGAEYDIHTAIYLDDLPRVQAIVKKSPKSANEDHGRSPLRTAVHLERYEICRFLVESHHVDVNDFQRGSGFPIIIKCLNNPRLVELLIRNGADLKTRITWRGGRSGIWIIGDNATALHYAVDYGVPQSITLLIDNGVDLFATAHSTLGHDSEKTALEIAAFFGNAENARAIVSHPKFDAADRRVRQAQLDKCLCTAAYLSWRESYADRTRLVELLLEKGADPNASEDGVSALDTAIAAANTGSEDEKTQTEKVIAILRAHGARRKADPAANPVPKGERMNVIALLRAGAESVNSKPFSNEELSSELNAHQIGGVLVEIGSAQIALEDVEGALHSATLLAPPDECSNCGAYFEFLEDLAVQLVRVGRLDAARTILKSHRHETQQTASSAWELEALARGYVEAKDVDAAKRTYREVADMIQGDGFGLCGVAKAQFEIGDFEGVRETRRLIEVAAGKLPLMGQERAILLANMAMLHFQLGDKEASRRILQDAPLALNSETFAWENAQRLIAAAHAKVGDFDGAIQAAGGIPENSGEREAAYMHIALLQWARDDLIAAQETSLLMKRQHDKRNLVLLEIVKGHAKKGDFKQALATAADVKGELRFAQATLEIVAAQAQQGKLEDARALTRSLVFPRAPRGFAFDNPKTWKPKDTIRAVISISHLLYEIEKENELVAAAVRCHVLLKGPGTIPRIEEMDIWNVRKAAEAQARVGDATGALAWTSKLSEGRRLSALIGVAYGVGDRLREEKTPSTKSRLGPRDMLRQRFDPPNLDE
jgi:ankyrin repeat protein